MLCSVCSTEFTTNGFLNPLSGIYPLCDECCKAAKLALSSGALNINSTTNEGLKAIDSYKEKLNYLSGFVSAYRDQIHTDILLKPRNNGPSIPTHRALLGKMPCEICGILARNKLCEGCLNGAKALHALLTMPDNRINNSTSHEANTSLSNVTVSKGFAYALRRTTEMKERLNYLSCCLDAFKGQIPTDILVKPGNNGPSIAAHKSLLSANSVVFKFMLDSDGCKAPPGHTITLEELSYLELRALLEFLYRAGLPEEKLETHIYALSVAADKYEIKLLQIRCENHMLTTLNTSNALEHLEISDTHKSYPHLKVAAMSFIVNNVEGIVFTPKFDSFAVKNPHLALQITRASVIATNKQKKRRL